MNSGTQNLAGSLPDWISVRSMTDNMSLVIYGIMGCMFSGDN